MARSDYTNNESPYSQPMSIFDAYRAGKFGNPNSNDPNEVEQAKHNRDYYLVDALANFGRNTAQDIGKYAAAYSGGNFTPEYTDSLWDARNKELMKPGAEAEAAGIKGSNANIGAEAAGQAAGQKDLQLKPAELFARDAADIRKKIQNNPNDPNVNTWKMEARLLDLLAGSAAGTDLNAEEYVAAAAASNPEIADLISNLATLAGSGTEMASSVLDIINNKIHGNANATTDDVLDAFSTKGDDGELITYNTGLNPLASDAQKLANARADAQGQIDKISKEQDKLRRDAAEYAKRYNQIVNDPYMSDAEKSAQFDMLKKQFGGDAATLRSKAQALERKKLPHQNYLNAHK